MVDHTPHLNNSQGWELTKLGVFFTLRIVQQTKFVLNKIILILKHIKASSIFIVKITYFFIKTQQVPPFGPGGQTKKSSEIAPVSYSVCGTCMPVSPGPQDLRAPRPI